MTGRKNTQQRVIDLPVAIRMNGDSFWNDPFDLVGHDAKMPAVTALNPELWLVFEYIEPETQGMIANPCDEVLRLRIGSEEPILAAMLPSAREPSPPLVNSPTEP